jgi:AAA domain
MPDALLQTCRKTCRKRTHLLCATKLHNNATKRTPLNVETQPLISLELATRVLGAGQLTAPSCAAAGWHGYRKQARRDLRIGVTTHGVHFNDKQGPTGTVILLSAEDGPEDTIKPRLEAAGANPEMIIDLNDIVVGDKQRPPEIPADLELIESVIKEHRAKLVIIEPQAAFLAGPDANKDQEIRRVLYKRNKIAETAQSSCCATSTRAAAARRSTAATCRSASSATLAATGLVPVERRLAG